MRSFAVRLRSLVVLLPLLAAPPAFSAQGGQTGGPTPEDATRRLFAAVQANDFAAVQSSIGAGADINGRNPFGVTAADVAVDRGYFRIAHYLVSVRNFQRPRGDQPAAGNGAGAGADRQVKAALIQGRPAANVSPVTPPIKSTTPAAAVKTDRMAAPVVSGRPPMMPAVTATAAAPHDGGDGADPFDPAKPVFGAVVPAVHPADGIDRGS